VSIEQDGKTHEEFASQVICTLPFSVLREVDGLDQLGLSAVKLDGIRNWGFGTNSKIMLETKTRPWRENGHAAPASSGSIYSDCASQAFWETTRMQGGTHGILSNFLGGKAGAVADRDTITRLALPDLARIHPGIENQFVKGVVHNWLKVPTARGSYSCLRPGQYLRFFGAGGEAELGGQLLFAGEQASIESSGYMNGAFETGIDAANKAIKALLMICRNSA
jgi:monoamine oxidase